jgi:predicted CopG family antitoxin
MKRKLTLSIDEEVYEQLGEIPRKVSISEVVSWMLKALVTDIKGMSDEDFRKFIESDPRGKEVRKYLQEKMGPLLDTLDSEVSVTRKSKNKE